MKLRHSPAAPPAASPAFADRRRMVASHRPDAMPGDVTARIERALAAEAARQTTTYQRDQPETPTLAPAGTVTGRRHRRAVRG
jgi:hypothetical protein